MKTEPKGNGKIIGFKSVLEYEKTHPTISKMIEGEVGWTVPWMVRMTKDGTIYLQDTEIDLVVDDGQDRTHGTATLRVKRISKEKDGYELNFTHVQDSITVVDSVENLGDGIVCPSPFIKIGKISENEVN